MNTCTRCVLGDTFPGISFDDKGVCNYCNNIPQPTPDEKREHQKKFEQLLADNRGKAVFDVLLAYSGGKDSTYTLKLLVKDYGMNVLAFSLDNGFMSEQARKNILHMTDSLGATSVFVRPPFPLLKKAFAFAAGKDIYSPKTLDRASSVCTTCIGLVKSMILKTAIAYGIPLVAYGWSPGQAPISSAIMKTNPRLQRITQRTVRDPLLAALGPELGKYFLTDDDLNADASKWPINIHPLAFMDYDEDRIVEIIRAMGWVKPLDTDPNSSNCLLNALANYVHRKRFNFHPYAWEIAGIVRSGQMDRKDGIEKVTQEEDMNMVDYAAKLLEVNV
jgi:hypothetical protein